MPEISIPEILIRTYNMHDRPRTWFNHRTIDPEFMVYKIANRFGRTNCKIKINPAELIEENT